MLQLPQNISNSKCLMFGLPFCKSCIFSVRTTVGSLRLSESVIYKENVRENRIYFPVVEMEISP